MVKQRFQEKPRRSCKPLRFLTHLTQILQSQGHNRPKNAAQIDWRLLRLQDAQVVVHSSAQQEHLKLGWGTVFRWIQPETMILQHGAAEQPRGNGQAVALSLG